MSRPTGNDRAADEDAAVRLALEGQVHARRQRQQRLARARLAHQRHEAQPLVQERVDRVVLLLVARPDAPQTALQLVEADELAAARVRAAQPGRAVAVLRADEHVLVGRHGHGQLNATVALKVLDLLGAQGDLDIAGRIGHRHVVGLVVLGAQPRGIGTNAQVDVLGDDDHGRAGMRSANRLRDPHDLGVRRRGGAVQDLLRLAVHLQVPAVLERHPRREAALLPQLV